MTTTQGDLAALSRYVFHAPRWYSSLAFALVIAAAAGVAAFDSRFVLEDAWQGVFFIGVPTVVASVGMPWADRRLGGQLTYNRASLLALTGELLLVAVLTVAGVVSVLTAFEQKFVFDALTVGLASVFAVQLFVVMAVSGKSLLSAAIPAGIQTGTAAVLVFVYGGTMRFVEIGGPLVRSFLYRPDRAPPGLAGIAPVDFALLAVLCGLYAFAVWAFLAVIDRPWRRGLGVSVLDFVRGFVGHIAEGSRELEDFFEAIGEEAVVPVTVCSFRSRAEVDRRSNGIGTGTGSESEGSETDGREGGTPTETRPEKVRFVLPMIHPGPMGEIGGGNLPERIAAHADGLAFPPHATAGHDFNLVTEREVEPIIDAAARAHERIAYTERGTRGERASSGEATVLGQRFGDDALIVGTYAPGFADDIDYGVGLAATAEARTHGLGTVMLIDGHNSNNGLDAGGLGHVGPGSQRSFDLLGAAGMLAERLRTAPDGDLRLGVAWSPTPWTPTEGIGPLGVRVAVSEVRDHRTAYVLVDGNNMEPGLRDRIVTDLEEGRETDTDAEADSDIETTPPYANGGATDEGECIHIHENVDRTAPAGARPIDLAEVMTTDTHIVNTMDSTNQVGEALPREELCDLIGQLVGDAIDDLEPVEAGLATERVRVTVFGNDRTETLASHANAMIAMGGALAVTVIAAVMAISVLIFFLA